MTITSFIDSIHVQHLEIHTPIYIYLKGMWKREVRNNITLSPLSKLLFKKNPTKTHIHSCNYTQMLELSINDHTL